MSGVNISICDGKYTVIQAPTGTTRVLRYGEEWRDVTGDNVIGGLAWELQDARDRIKRLEEDLMDAKNQYAVLLADVALYEDRGERIKRMEDAGDALYANCDPSRWDSPAAAARKLSDQNAWHKAKEAP